MRGEILKGHLDMLLLAAVRTQPLHGYALIEELRRLSGGAFDLPEGTAYPALHRLERLGLLKSHWSSVGGRQRRVYQITSRGLASLLEFQREWERFSQGVGSILEGDEWPSGA